MKSSTNHGHGGFYRIVKVYYMVQPTANGESETGLSAEKQKHRNPSTQSTAIKVKKERKVSYRSCLFRGKRVKRKEINSQGRG